jgi:hypothetical protein
MGYLAMLSDASGKLCLGLLYTSGVHEDQNAEERYRHVDDFDVARIELLASKSMLITSLDIIV